ncbi:uncharacterized protein V1513DRAFT_448435 [Lipomyces chichibuensis]|uniref:uncharacterized protein n=1 Tax=Lipomyces chichibuensis TaxID=1546026 RepID=UPI003343D42D
MEGMKKFQKSYTFMDASDTYYTAVILDPRIKRDLLMDELEEEDALERSYKPFDSVSITTIRSTVKFPHYRYNLHNTAPNEIQWLPFRRLKPLAVEAKSDVDRYFFSSQIGVDTVAMDGPNWLFQ